MATRCVTRSCSQLAASTSASAARTFVQLGPRRYLHSTPPPILEFLLPGVSTPALQHGWPRSKATYQRRQQLNRTFTLSAGRQATTAVINPRKDDAGLDMNIEITPRASKRLREIMSKDANPNLALRIQVESGGCHGFQYLMSLTTIPSLEEQTPALNKSSQDPNAMSSTSPTGNRDSTSEVDDDEDTVFSTDDGSGAKVVMDGPSLELLKGSKIDYTMELIGSQFKIVDNPLATSSCGCGTSFDVKT